MIQVALVDESVYVELIKLLLYKERKKKTRPDLWCGVLWKYLRRKPDPTNVATQLDLRQGPIKSWKIRIRT